MCLYPEVAGTLCSWLERQFGIPCVRTVPIGIGATMAFLREVHSLLDLELPAELQPGADGVCEAERRRGGDLVPIEGQVPDGSRQAVRRGEVDGVDYIEAFYEGYAPGGVAA